MNRRCISLLLAVVILVGLAVIPLQSVSAVTAVSKTDDEIIEATMSYLNIKEGNCDSVNANDNGAVSIGMIQWHGTRALNILKKIVALIPEYAEKVLGEAFYQEILTATNWETRIVNAEEKAALIILLGTEESKQVQLAQARSDIGTYLNHAKQQGMSTPAMQLYFMDIENQYGSGGAERMVKYAKQASGMEQSDSFKCLKDFHNGMRKAAYQLEYNNSVTPYMSRRESTYTHLVETLKWETDVPYLLITAPCGTQGDAHISLEVFANDTFSFPHNPYVNEGFVFEGWTLNRIGWDLKEGKLSNCYYISGIGWCTPNWIDKQGYTKCLYQPGQSQTVDSKFLSSASQGALYRMVPVWKAAAIASLPVSSNGCTHSWNATASHEASCVSGAYTNYTCTKCGAKERNDSSLPNGHCYGQWTVQQAAACDSVGLRSRICTVCNLKQTDMLAALGHQAGEPKQTAAPTCTAEGRSEISCLRCGVLLQWQAIPSTGHTPGEAVTDQAASCTVAGKEHTCCTVCKTVLSSTVLPAQHSFGDWVDYTPATEMGDGVRTRRCTVCGYTEIQKIPGGNHVHSYTKTTAAPTCSSAGNDLYTCFCGDTYTENTVPALGHRTQSVVNNATCCSAGFSINICSRCDAIWTTGTTPALGHSWDSGTVTKAATADTDGLQTLCCTRCGAKKTERIPATGTCLGGNRCPAHQFTDMPSGWAHAGLDFCVARGLLSGTSNTRISPNEKMSRAMLVMVLYSLEGKPAVSGSSYSDVPKGIWYERAVSWATGCGIVSGTGNNCFSPDSTVTREQTAAILYRYAIYKDLDFTASAEISGYPDWAKASLYARAGMKWAVGSGIISGKPTNGKNYLDPLGSTTRAEMATILMAFLKKVAQ